MGQSSNCCLLRSLFRLKFVNVAIFRYAVNESVETGKDFMLIGEVLRRRRQPVATKKGAADQFRRARVRRFWRRSEGQVTERDISSRFATV